MTGYWPSAIGAKTSASSRRPSSITMPWCHVIFMPSRSSVRARTSGTSLIGGLLHGSGSVSALRRLRYHEVRRGSTRAIAMMLPMPRGRVFYGWWVVAAGFGIESLIGALMFHAYGAYLVLLREEFGWSKTMLSAAFAMARAESGILGPVQGWLTDRFGPRVLIRVGMVIFGLGFILFSRIDGPVAFFVTFFIMALGSSLGGYLPVGVAIVAWFRRRRALALSLSASGMAVGGLLTPLVVLALSRFGWRWTALASGVLILAAGLPLAQVMRRRPEAYGWTPDGDPPQAAPAAAAPARTAPAQRDFTPREALATRAFWYISAGHAAALLVVSAVMVHMIIHVTERL